MVFWYFFVPIHSFDGCAQPSCPPGQNGFSPVVATLRNAMHALAVAAHTLSLQVIKRRLRPCLEYTPAMFFRLLRLILRATMGRDAPPARFDVDTDTDSDWSAIRALLGSSASTSSA